MTKLRWNRALEGVTELDNSIGKHMSEAPIGTPISSEDFTTLAFDLKTI